MASKSNLPFGKRGEIHKHPVTKRLFQIAESKQSNLVISADFTDSKSLLKCADGKSIKRVATNRLLTPLNSRIGPVHRRLQDPYRPTPRLQ